MNSGTNKNISASSVPWFRLRFGYFLIKFDEQELIFVRHSMKTVFSENTREKENHTNNICDQKTKIVALYFTPYDPTKYLNEDITEDLKGFYLTLNENVETNKRFEVVQINFPQKAPNLEDALFRDDFKKKCESQLMDVPWFALPVDRIENLIRLRHYYGVRDGEFALVLLDASSGKLITRQGYRKFLEDRAGNSFPWARPDVMQLLKSIPRYFSNSQTDLSKDERSNLFQVIDRDTIIGLYFSAHWCPPCKAFTSQLVEAYHSIKEKGENFEIILVSSDRSTDSYSHHVSKMPWMAIPYEDSDSRAQLTSLFGVQAIPSLILLNPDGSVITEDGRGEVNEDPKGLNFPWYQKTVNVLTPRVAAKLQTHPGIVLFTDGEEDVEVELATAVLAPVCEYARKKYDEELLFFIATDSDTSDSLRKYLRLDDDVSPLMTLIDIPLARFTVMEYGKEITEKSIINFINQFYNDELNFLPINSK